MQFKNVKKETPKKGPVKENKSKLKNDEIREIVEETVGEVLKEQSEEIEPKEPQDATLSEDSSKNETNPSDSPEDEHASEENAPVAYEENSLVEKEEKTDAVSESSISPTDETKQNLSGKKPDPVTQEIASTPVIGVSSFSQPITQIQDSAGSPKGSSMVRLFIIFMLIGVAAGGAVWYAMFHNIFAIKLPPIPGIYSPATPTPTKSPSLTISPTSTPVSVSVAKYDVSILNGSGVAGAASKAKATLADAGFTVVSTGNANTSDFTETVIAAKSSVDSVTIAKLNQTLSGNYTVSSHTLSLDDSQTADIIVTLGSSTK